MDRARMNSAIRVFNEAVVKNDFDGMVSEKVGCCDKTDVHVGMSVKLVACETSFTLLFLMFGHCTYSDAFDT